MATESNADSKNCFGGVYWHEQKQQQQQKNASDRTRVQPKRPRNGTSCDFFQICRRRGEQQEKKVREFVHV